MNALVLAVLQLVVVHTIDGREVSINPKQVTSLHGAVDGKGNKLLTGDVSCVVGLTDGKFISVAENCDAVRKLLEDAK
jgi:hypothetical protein